MPNDNLHHEYALPNTNQYVERMALHWVTPEAEGGLGLCCSIALRSLWRIMCENFIAATRDAATGVQSPWRILQPPTGTGKTEGARIYAAMQADLNHNASGDTKPVGVIIVTRLIEEADRLARDINATVGRRVAVAHHSNGYVGAEELHASDVVIITHTAFLNANRGVKQGDVAPWDRLVTWRGGQRLLTIIDEALANVVDESSATTEGLAFVLGLIPPALRASLPQEVAVLEQVHRVLQAFVDLDNSDGSMAMIWGEGNSPASIDLGPLRSAMKVLPYDRMVYGRTNGKDRQRLAERVDRMIQAVEACLAQYAYYSKAGDWHSINSAALAVPLNTPGPVVLDATARTNFLWDLFEERHVRPAIPGRARDYSTVRLHVARATALGKNSMEDKVRERLPRVKRAIEDALSEDRSVFLCVHKGVAENAVTTQWAMGSKFASFSVGHWGAVDGLNKWKDYDVAVILGLPYRPQTWATNVFCALQGAQDDTWLGSPEWRQYKNVRKEMERRQLSVSMIQAINRICLRRVIDSQGRCPPADVFIVLPQDATGDAILEDIKLDMPEIDVRHWDFELDPPKVKKPRNGSSHQRLIEYMAGSEPGTVPLSTVQHALSLRCIKKLRETLNDNAHPATRELREMGVTYIPGLGRGSKSYLLKAAA